MGRRFFAISVMLGAGLWWLLARPVGVPHTEGHVAAPLKTILITHGSPLLARAPAQIIAVPEQAPPLERNEVAELPSEERTPSTRPALKQAGRTWNWLEDVAAVPAREAQAQGLQSLTTWHGHWLVRAGDVPASLRGLPVVAREDNPGVVGIFTGVLKAIGEKRAFLDECPCDVEAAYPSIKSYLLRARGAPEELHSCLSELQAFRQLEWEILDRSRGPR
jgi:hypothetical protein